MTRMTIGGESFRVEVEGDASRPALLLSNSLGTDLHLWDAQMPALLEHFRVIRYDSRGHGDSVTSGQPISIEDLGRDALRILDALEIPRVHFVGISMGGAVGQWLLVHAPERIDRMVLACTAARFGTPEGWNERIVSIRNKGMAEAAKATMERWFSPAFAKAHADDIAAIRKMLQTASVEGYAANCAALRDMDLRQWLVGIDVPTLLMTGSDDPVITTKDTAFLKGALTDSTHVSLPTRHIANVEAAAAFNEAVLKFLTARRSSKPRRLVAPTKAPARRAKTSTRATTARRPLAKVATRPRKARAAAAARKAAAAKPRKAPTSRTKRAVVRTAPVRATAGKPVAAKKAAPAKKTTARKKSTVKSAPSRRPTKATAVRGAVKKTATKPKPTKTTKKKTKAATTKRLPTARRKATKSPRRPSGRRKR